MTLDSGRASVRSAVVPVRELCRRAGVLLALVLVSMAAAPTASAQSDPSMDVRTAATYRVDVESGRVDVQFDYLFENPTAATAFPGFFESVPVDAVDVAARDATGPLEVAAVPDDADEFDTWLVGFRSPLEPGESVALTLSWALDGGIDREGTMVAPGAVAFDVYVPGPPGAEWAPVAVEVPEGFVAVETPEPTTPYEIVRASYLDVDAFVASTSSLPPDVTVLDWDPAGGWSATVLERAGAVVASLDQWFGPRTAPLEIRRTFPADGHPTVTTDRVEVVGDDAESIDHQLAHAWMADLDVDEPWFVEGLAAAFAGDRPDPEGPADVVPVVVNEIGAAGVREIVDALRAGTISYPGPSSPSQPLPPDWRTLLDLMEEVAGAHDVDELFRASVVEPEDAAALDRRAAARVDHDALVFRAGGWTLPPYLRVAMAAWEFDDFSARQGPVSDVLVRRDALHAWAESLALEPRDDGKALFEAAEADMAEVNELLDEQEAALGAFDEAERLVNGDRGLLAAVGLFGQDPDGDLDALRASWAEGDYAAVEHDGHELAARLEGAVGAGTIRLLVPALLLVGVWQLVRWFRRRSGGNAASDGPDEPAPPQP